MKPLSAGRGARAALGAGGLAELFAHERKTWSGHWAELHERLAVARKARNLGELLRDQLDLLPETRARLRGDQRERGALLRNWLREIRDGWRAVA